MRWHACPGINRLLAVGGLAACPTGAVSWSATAHCGGCLIPFEVECIDRMYLNVYVPQLQYATGLVSYIHRHLGMPVASTAALAPVTEAFAKAVRAFALDRQIPWVDFAKGQRKDDVAHQYLDRFTGAEGVLFVGRAQEKTASVPHPQTSPGRRQLLPVDCRRNWGGQPVLLLLRRRGLRPVLPEVLQLLPVQRQVVHQR